MDLPFELILRFGQNKNNFQEEKLQFSEKEIFGNPMNIIKIKEFDNINFLFYSTDNTSKLFIPELDDYSLEGQIEENDGAVFYRPNNEPITIFSYEEKRTVPLIPGYYLVVVTIKGEKYFSQFEIIPKDLKVSEWEIMKDEIEEKVSGLAIDFIERKASKRQVHSRDISENFIFQRIQNLLEDISQAMISLDSLKNEAKYKISKHYSWKPIGSKNITDQNTIKQMQVHPEKKGFLYTPNRIIVYDIIDNQWIKNILLHFKRFCIVADEYLDNVLVSLREERNEQEKFIFQKSQSDKLFFLQSYNSRVETILDNKKTIKHFYAYILDFLDTTFMKNVTSKRLSYVPKALVLNPKYNSLYKMYLRNIRSTESINYSPSYQYYWKRTDLLYEIWSYIKVLDALICSEYLPKNGWIFDNKSVSQELPFLHDGTKIELSRKDVTLSLVFNEPLKNEKFKNSTNDPLKTSSNRNKPDIRLDIFINGEDYIGSIIFEVKYKKLKNIIINDKTGKQKQQLMSYKQNTMSSILAFPEFLQRRLRAVDSVIALYPSEETGRFVPEYFNDEEIHFLLLNPSVGYSELKLKINSKIDELVHFYKESILGRSAN